MKKLNLIVAALMFGLSMLIVSCGKENDAEENKVDGVEDNDVVDSVALDVAATYVGNMAVKLQEMPNVAIPSYENMEIRIVAGRGDAVDVAFPEVSYDLSGRIMVLPSFTATYIPVSKQDAGSYRIGQKAYEVLIDDKSLVGSVQGTVEDGVLTLDYSIKYGSMPMTLLFHFVSNK